MCGAVVLQWTVNTVLAKTPSFVFDSVLEIFSCFLTSSWIVLKSWSFKHFSAEIVPFACLLGH